MATLRDLVNARAATAAAVALDNTKIATDAAAVTAAQSVVTADQTQLAADQAADLAAQTAIASGISKEPNDTGFAVDTNPNADGSFTLYVEDTSPTGYHTVNISSLDTVLSS